MEQPDAVAKLSDTSVRAVNSSCSDEQQAVVFKDVVKSRPNGSATYQPLGEAYFLVRLFCIVTEEAVNIFVKCE